MAQDIDKQIIDELTEYVLAMGHSPKKVKELVPRAYRRLATMFGGDKQSMLDLIKRGYQGQTSFSQIKPYLNQLTLYGASGPGVIGGRATPPPGTGNFQYANRPNPLAKRGSTTLSRLAKARPATSGLGGATGGVAKGAARAAAGGAGMGLPLVGAGIAGFFLLQQILDMVQQERELGLAREQMDNQALVNAMMINEDARESAADRRERSGDRAALRSMAHSQGLADEAQINNLMLSQILGGRTSQMGASLMGGSPGFPGSGVDIQNLAEMGPVNPYQALGL